MKYEFQDHYFNLAKKEWYVARSAYKLQEIDDKFHLFNKETKTVIDIGCAPGSRCQYTDRKLEKLKIKDYKIVGFDLKSCNLSSPNIHTYEQDIEEHENVKNILDEHEITKVDCIISDMAPDTSSNKNADAIRSIALLEDTFRMYENLLKPDGKFAIKVFMGPGFQEFYNDCKTKFGGPKHVKIFKPKACRKASKETYIVKM